MPKGEIPSVLGYDDFRAYLRGYYRARKRLDPRFSYGAFALRAGLSTRSHLKNVLDYGLDLSRNATERYVAALRLGPEEAHCFRLLVRWNQAREPAAREAARAELQRWRWEREIRSMTEDDARRILQWANYLVLGASRMKGFRADPRWISRRLLGKVTPRQAAEALRFLRAKGFLRLRGSRLVDVKARSFATEAPPGGALDALYRRILREAASAGGGSRFVSAILTRQEAADLTRKIDAWVLENVPRKGRKRLKGELCIILNDVFPLTAR